MSFLNFDIVLPDFDQIEDKFGIITIKKPYTGDEYHENRYYCKACNKEFSQSTMYKHIKTKTHNNAFKQLDIVNNKRNNLTMLKIIN
jgi:hypothetical protein